MSAELSALETLAEDYTGGWYRISPISLAVLFYASRFWKQRFNWVSPDPLDVVTDSDWDTIQAYVDGLLYEVKNPMLGQIVAYATEELPAGVLLCDGSTFNRVDYPDLYNLLDSVFILDADTFIVPDLTGRTIVSVGMSVEGTDFVIGAAGGEELHQLITDELPAHTHTIPATTTTLAVEPGEVAVTTPVPIITADTGSTGNDSPHNNMQPYFVLKYGIVAL